MLLTEEGIEEFINKLKKDRLNLDQINMRYSPGYHVIFSGQAVSGIVQSEDYYSNFKENIIAAEFSWLKPICEQISTNIEAEIAVLPNGDFNKNSIELTVNIHFKMHIPNIKKYLYNQFKSLVIFYPYINSMRIKGNKGHFSNIYLKLKIDPNKITKAINNKDNFNKQTLAQWLFIANKCLKDNYHRDEFDNTFKVINGKINYRVEREAVKQYFKL